jgi:MFS family permease
VPHPDPADAVDDVESVDVEAADAADAAEPVDLLPPAPRRARALRLARSAAIDLTPLRHEHFRRLWTGNSIAFIGFQVTAVAVPVQVYEVSRSSFWVGMLGAVGLVPLIVFGLWGGAIADAVDRRVLLVVSSLVLWGCTGALLVQALLGLRSLGLLLVLVAVQAGAFAVASSTRGAVIPRVLPPEDIASANTLSFTASTLATAAGPLVAGLVLARWSFAVAYALDAVLFTLALYAAIRLPPLPPLYEADRGAAGDGPPGSAADADPARRARANVPGLRSVVEGLAFISTRPVLLLSFGVDIVAMVLAMPRALFPQAAVERFGGEGAVGWLFAAIAIGSSVAGLSSGWIRRVRRQGVALVVAIVIWGVAIALSGLANALWVAVLLLAVGGAADLVSAVYRQTILQTYAPDELRGRLQGVFIVVVAGGPRLGDLRAGATAAAVGLQASWVGGGWACAVLVLAALLPRSLRHYDAARVIPPSAA